MKRFTLLIMGLVTLFSMAIPASAQTSNTIADVIRADSRYSTLLDALAIADPSVLEALSAAGDYTLFAPTNQAFQNLAGYLEIDVDTLLADPALVTDLLLYHTVDQRLTAQDLIALDGQLVYPLLDDTAFRVVIENGATIRLNGISRVTSPFDTQASNGLVHTMADMIFPNTMQGQLEALKDGGVALPTAEPETTPEAQTAPISTGDEITVTGEEDVPAAPQTTLETVATFPEDLTIAGRILSDSRYTTLASILETVAPDYLDLLNSADAEFTVIVPNNSAFDNLFYTLGISLDDALENPVLLRQILAYHIAQGIYSADDLQAMDGERINTILVNPDFRESVLVLVDGNAVTLNTIVRLTTTDQGATNGLMQGANNVLLPQVALDTLTGLGLWDAEESGAG